MAQTYHFHICSWWGWSTVIWKRRETERGTDICFAARSCKCLIMLFPNDEDKWGNKNLRASRTSYKTITVRVLRGNIPAMGHNCRSTNGGDPAVKYLFLPFLLFLVMGGGMRLQVSVWLSPPSSSPCCSYLCASSFLSGLSTGRPILHVHKQKNKRSFDYEQMQKAYVIALTKKQMMQFHFWHSFTRLHGIFFNGMCCAASRWNSIKQNKVHAVSARMESCFRFHFSHQVSALAVSTLSHTGIQELLWQDGYKWRVIVQQ